jgi:NADP-dependent 3-hydroxy acid dehydrogenase YdfG
MLICGRYVARRRRTPIRFGDETRLRVDDVEREDLVAKTWFITGASKGFGREWTEAALERGDKVAATARNLETLDALVNTYGDAVFPIQLDVTDREADFEAVRKAADALGQLDVVINNAGYGHFGAIE